MSHAGVGPVKRVTAGVWILAGCALLTLVSGIIGHLAHPHGGEGCPPETSSGFWHYFEAVYGTLALFNLEHTNAAAVRCHGNPLLVAAAILGPVTFYGALGSLFWVLLADQRTAWKLRRARNHLVVIGYGAKGRERALEHAHERGRVVAIEAAPSEAAAAHARTHGVLLVEGDAREPRVLARARLERATSVVIATGDDTRNLELARSVVERLEKTRRRSVHVSIGNPLLRRALAASHLPPSIDLFSIEDLAAYALCESARFFEIADLLGQRRVHVVIVGFVPASIHLAAQVVRTGRLMGMDEPAVTLLSARPEEARNALRLAYPGMEAIAQARSLHYHPLARPADDPGLMDEVERPGPATAVVTFEESGFDALANALAIREAGRRTGRWQAPLFFAAAAEEPFRAIERPLRATRRYSEVLQSFDTSAQLCTMRRTRERDRVARAVHERYLRVHREEQGRRGTPAAAGEALQEWDQLAASYRQANRRAADHVPAKLVSVGCIVPEGPIHLSIDTDEIVKSPLMESLAELEHEVWMIDRKLDGWRAGPVRDDATRVHNLLVPYAELSEPMKELDRDQIRTLLTKTLPRASREPARKAVRFDLWVGLVGTAHLAPTELGRLMKEVSEAVSRIVEARPNHHVTLLSALGPGADFVAAQSAMNVLRTARRPHRLLVPNALRFPDMVASFEPAWRAGAIGTPDAPASGEWKAASTRILADIQAILDDAACERIVELARAPLQADDKQRQHAHRLHNAYIVERTHVLIAAAERTGQAGAGSAREAMIWRRTPLSAPEEWRLYRKRPNPLGPGLSDFVTIELGG
jgi:voltage-gated potassium channel Kch